MMINKQIYNGVRTYMEFCHPSFLAVKYKCVHKKKKKAAKGKMRLKFKTIRRVREYARTLGSGTRSKP